MPLNTVAGSFPLTSERKSDRTPSADNAIGKAWRHRFGEETQAEAAFALQAFRSEVACRLIVAGKYMGYRRDEV